MSGFAIVIPENFLFAIHGERELIWNPVPCSAEKQIGFRVRASRAPE